MTRLPRVKSPAGRIHVVPTKVVAVIDATDNSLHFSTLRNTAECGNETQQKVTNFHGAKSVGARGALIRMRKIRSVPAVRSQSAFPEESSCITQTPSIGPTKVLQGHPAVAKIATLPTLDYPLCERQSPN